MKKFEYKQNDLKRGIPFAIIYFAVLLTICYIKFDGFLGMANAVDNIGNSKVIGFLIGLLALAPFIIILNLIMPKVTIEFLEDRLIITKNKDQQVINYWEIAALQLNITNLNRLDFINNERQIQYYIHPQNKTEILNQVISELSKHITFVTQQGSKQYFGKSIATTIYVKKI